MALDRQSIEKKDFPVGRRGYDPEAVDAHLASLADEIADLKHSARRRSDTLASSASDQVRSIVEAAESMLKRLDAMESELGSLIESLRTGGNRLTADLKLLESNLTEVRGVVVSPRPQFEPEESDPAVAESIPEPAVAESIPESDGAPAEPEAQVAANGEVSAGGGDDAEGTRLIALNMALNGTPREETARYLNENFSLNDANGLLDEVYASVDG